MSTINHTSAHAGDWTSLLVHKLKAQQQGSSSDVRLTEAGAYGQGCPIVCDHVQSPLLAHLRYACATRCRHMLDHESLLLIAGGTGISAFLSILASLTCPAYRASKISKASWHVSAGIVRQQGQVIL